MAEEQKSHYSIALTPYSQNIKNIESEQQQLYNQEQGSVSGINYQISFLSKNWRITASMDKSKGAISYIGTTQLGRKASTTTVIKQDIIQLLVANKLIHFSGLNCLRCGELDAFIVIKHQGTQRDILSNGNITGLKERYHIPMVGLGLAWQVKQIFQFNWQLKIWRSQAFNPTLAISFLSSYDESKIKLNAVYANQGEFSISYPLSEAIQLGLIVSYSESEIERSDNFPLYIEQYKNGSFYQPPRTIKTTSLGLRFEIKF